MMQVPSYTDAPERGETFVCTKLGTAIDTKRTINKVTVVIRIVHVARVTHTAAYHLTARRSASTLILQGVSDE